MITYRKSDIPEHLQKYFKPAEIGLEQTPDAYVAEMVAVFREVWRVLRDDGTLWLTCSRIDTAIDDIESKKDRKKGG